MAKKKLPMSSLPPYESARELLSYTQKVGQLFMPAAFINDSEEEIKRLEHLIREYHIGSLCFFHSRASAATNFEGKKEVIYNEKSYERLVYLIQRYQEAATYPLLIAIDAEWGLAMRIENSPQYPYAITLGAMKQQAQLVYEVGQNIGKDCREAGIHWNLSPVVDINLNPDNPVIGYRSFGNDKAKVTQYANAYLKGMRSQGVLNAIKHFPGHGDTATDSHLGLPVIDKPTAVLLENELYPFLELLQEDIDAIMVGHLAVPALSEGKRISASISKEILSGFLRDELGWEGLIISDALNMHAVAKDFPDNGGIEEAAFTAGNDVLCFADKPIEGIQRILNTSPKERIEASFKRLWQLKQKAFAALQEATEQAGQEHHNLMLKLAQKSITMLKGDTNDLQRFREQQFRCVQIGKQESFFLDTMNHQNEFSDAVVLSIFPRQVKPKNSFGFADEELHQMRKLLRDKKVVLYLFGNPFVLNLIPWDTALAVVIVYQDTETFQKNALAHFKGEVRAEGQLPATLKGQYE